MKHTYKFTFLLMLISLFYSSIFSQTIVGIDGTSGTYTNFNELMVDITSATGDLRFSVSGEFNEQVNITTTSASSVTFIGDGTANINPDNFSNGNYVLKIDGSRYNFENIKFQNSSTDVGIGNVIVLGDNNEDNTFTNCIFNGRNDLNPDEQSDTYSVINSPSLNSSLNTTFYNDTINGGSYGFYIDGIESSILNIQILGCEINDFTFMGIYYYNVSEFIIENNSIRDKTGVTITTTGIHVDNAATSFSINANKIDLTSATEKIGIKLLNINTLPDTYYTLSNNMISSRNATSAIATGIWLEDCSEINTIYNSIYITDGNNQSSAFKIYDASLQTSSNNILLNNLLINNSPEGYSMILQGINALADFNNNDYFSSGGNLINSGGSDFATLIEWQLYDSQMPVDINSFSALPSFISASDLHLTEGSLSYVEERAQSSMIISTDIDGEQRDIDEDGFADIGADEGNFNLLWTGDILDVTNWADEIVIEGEVTIVNIGGITKSGNLNIEQGTTLKFRAGAKLICNAQIDAIGTKDEPILFTSENETGTWGGITYSSSSSIDGMYQYCKFENSTNSNGGVFDIIGSTNNVSIINCKFSNNSGTNGGAIYISDNSPFIESNFFFNNFATGSGGAIYSINMPPSTLFNNIFYNNSSAINGGALYFDNIMGSTIILNNTFHLNYATSLGQSIYISNSNFQIYNSIFWNDFDGNQIYSTDPTSNSITNCIIKGGFETGTNIENYNTILANDPLFKDINNFNFSVQANSIAVDGGTDNGGTISLPEFDFAGNERVYYYGIIDIGAYELQAPRLFADAGNDLSECYNSQMLPYVDVYPYKYEWTVLNYDGVEIIYNESSPMINNLPAGIPIEVELSVTNGFITERDTLVVTNTQPIVDAGEDIFLINLDINNDIFPDTSFNANSDMPAMGLFGYWTMLSSTATPSPTIEDTQSNTSSVTGINYGISSFKWTISDEASCSNSDTVLIIAGHSYTSIPDGTFDWNTPSDWEEGVVPGIADSVTIYGVTGTVGAAGGNCDRLYIGNGATINIEGTAKAVSNFNCRVLSIEESTTKFKNVKGGANLYIKDNASLNIGGEYVSKSSSTSGSGLFIGSGGTVFIRPNAEKETKGSAELNIGSGGFIFIRPNAEKSSKATAGLNIGSGGFVFIRPNAEKSKTTKSITEGDIVIGSGGYLNLEQTIAGTSGGYLELGSKRTIYISPSTAKAAGGNFGIYGGTVFIRPNAEKSSKTVANYGVYCGSGGTIFIRPNAEKVLAESNLITPNLFIDGGKVIVGNNTKFKSATGSLSFNQIFIRPNAEKGIIADTSLIIYPSGELVLSDSAYWDIPIISISNGAAVSFLEGSIIKLSNNNFNTSNFYLEKGASLIDMNPFSDYYMYFDQTFEGGEINLFSPSVETINVWDLGLDKTINSWTEETASWIPLADADVLNAGLGYLIKYNWSDTYKQFNGKVNTGEFNTPVSLTDIGNFKFEGWNLVGNPYPSAIDLEKIILPVDFYNTFYTYNPTNKQYVLYQQGGVSLNGGSQYIPQNQAFFIKTDANSTFTIDNDARVHFMNITKNETKEINNILKLKVSGILYSDETAILFNNNATDYFDKEYDASKITDGIVTPIIYSKVSGDDTPVAINTLEYVTETKTIPLYFEAGTIGNYTIDVTELVFDNGVTISLKDLKDNSIHDLIANPSYTFTYSKDDNPNRFEVIFTGFSNLEDVTAENNIDIFSNKNTIFINSKYGNSQVEVYDLNGKLLIQKNIINSGTNSINVNLPQSIYIVKLITSEKSICKKIVISK